MGALRYFDINAETTLLMDVSKKGSGTALMQQGQVISSTSCALTKTKENYQNLEIEKP